MSRKPDYFIKVNVGQEEDIPAYYQKVVDDLTKKAKAQGLVLKTLTIKEAEALGLPTKNQLELRTTTETDDERK
jgi:hypothetical protein